MIYLSKMTMHLVIRMKPRITRVRNPMHLPVLVVNGYLGGG